MLHNVKYENVTSMKKFISYLPRFKFTLHHYNIFFVRRLIIDDETNDEDNHAIMLPSLDRVSNYYY